MAETTRTVFLGSGEFAVPILEALAGAPGIEVVGVVTTPPRPAGREGYLTSTPVERWARRSGHHVLAPERLRDPICRVAIEVLEPELMVLSDYGRIVPQELLDIPRLGALNLHPSLLPRHRGAVPIPAAILAGDTETGVSLMRMDAGLDTGPIVARTRVPLEGTEDTPSLEVRLSHVAADLLVGSLPGWIAGDLPAVPQEEAGATLTRPFRREDGRLDPTRPAVDLERAVRALRPWPGTYLERPDGRLIVHEAGLAAAPIPPGSTEGDLVAIGDGKQAGLGLVTSDGVLRLDVVQPSGKGRMSGPELVRGRPGWLASGSAAE
ncbi:MAG: methionyl-tRNA formyltransferase [Candidatus Limnocylindrales bacterium]